MNDAVPTARLGDGAEIPRLGLGAFGLPTERAREIVETALQSGYRHLDTAPIYGNDRQVGEAIAASPVGREEIFVTSKLWNTEHGYDAALAAADARLADLGLDYLDLYLIHWPLPGEALIVETWRAFERLREEGVARSIGVSNFRIEDLETLARETDARPVLNQVELHPRFPQRELREYHAEHGIATEAWSPFARGDLLGDGTLAAIASRHDRSPAQVVLRWQMQLGNIAVPRSTSPARLRENLEIFDFELAAAEMEEIAGLETGVRIGPDPADQRTA